MVRATGEYVCVGSECVQVKERDKKGGEGHEEVSPADDRPPWRTDSLGT